MSAPSLLAACCAVVLIAGVAPGASAWRPGPDHAEAARTEAQRRLEIFESQFDTYSDLAIVVGQVDTQAAFIDDLILRLGANAPGVDSFADRARRARSRRLREAVEQVDLDALAQTPGGSGLLADIAMLSTEPDLLGRIVALISIEVEQGRFHPLYFKTLERRLAASRLSASGAPPAGAVHAEAQALLETHTSTIRKIGRVAGLDDWSRDLIMGHLRAFQSDLDARAAFEAAAGAFILSNIDEPNAELVLEVFDDIGFHALHAASPSLARKGVSVLQHAGSPGQMRDILREIEPLASAGAFDGQTYALLHDRVALRADAPQRFGSQIICVDGRHEVYLLEAPDTVDSRRARFDLMPLAEYLAIYRENAPVCER